jgi:hypothetical protein
VTTLSIGLGDTHAKWTDTVALATKTWNHIVLTWDNGKYVVYTNGVKSTEGTYTGLTALDPVANISDDDNPDEHEAFDGMLDEARIYNRAITAAEVKEIFQMPAAPRIKAWSPNPADGVRTVTMPLLQWKSLDTIKLHDVYVGTDPNLTAEDLSRSPPAAEDVLLRPGLAAGHHVLLARGRDRSGHGEGLHRRCLEFPGAARYGLRSRAGQGANTGPARWPGAGTTL